MKRFLLGFLLLSIFACKTEEQSLKFEPIEFELNTANWDKTPYKFDSEIKDSVITKFGNQYAATEYASVGNFEQTLKTWDTGAKPLKDIEKEDADIFKSFEPRDAIPYILAQAKQHDITMINEAHHIPQHRVFTTQLLQGLYDQGYRHLGLEALFLNKEENDLMPTRKYSTLKNGYYTKEPQFGNLLREALKIGYTLFPYEAGDVSGKEREIGQAQNILNYIKTEAKGKILIHCGFAHATEGLYGRSWEKAMAERVKEMTGKDILSIDQTTYAEKTDTKLENPYYRLYKGKKSQVFVNDADLVFGQYKPEYWFDIYVFHPRTTQFNRPEWMIYGDRKQVTYSLADLPFDCPCMVLAYKDGEEIGSAIPYDVQEIKDKRVTLVLGKGKYILVVRNKDGKSIQSVVEN